MYKTLPNQYDCREECAVKRDQLMAYQSMAETTASDEKIKLIKCSLSWVLELIPNEALG